MIDNTLVRVINSIASTTRYPRQLLTEDADLENDLGIDSVKRLEIVLDLGEEFQIRLDLEPNEASIRTIRDVADWVDRIQFRNKPVSSPRLDPPSATSIPTPISSKFSSISTKSVESPIGSFSSSNIVARNATNAPLIESSGGALSEPFYQGVHTTRSHTVTPHLGPVNGMTNLTSGRPLHGKVALVTGSGHGVGQTIARLLASRGATVIVNSFHSREMGERTASEINSRGDAAIHLWGSVANSEHVDDIFRQIHARFDRLDILICNASDGRIGKFLELDTEDWDRAFRTNVIGHHQCAIRAASMMRYHGGGSIVTMSAVGSHGYIDGLGCQGVVKAAVETMTRYLACELGQYGIRVNCVVGGPVYGELLSKFPNSRSAQQHWESMTADGSLCCPMDLANAIGFLVSEESKGVNGSIWNVDHGFTATADGRPLRYPVAQQLVS